MRASHEWFAGGGYPRKIAGDAIPLASRIIAAVDAYDAMTQDRAYRIALRLLGRGRRAPALLARPSSIRVVVNAFLAVLGSH